jgi:pSer/pThr/pTyr-binding forkhead associated (FHA) protein
VAPFNTGPSLVVISDAGRARQIPVPSNGIVLGRDTSLGPPFSTDEFVSRNHVSVRCRGAVVEIADLGSANGTFVNGTRVRASAQMQDSDVLRIGQIVLKLAAPTGMGQTVLGGTITTADVMYLTIVSPDAFSGRQFPLSGDYLVVGRDPVSDIQVNDPHVSRKHAALRRRGDAVFVEDLGSYSGTFVNGRPVAGACELKPGDIVAFAGVNARFDKVGEAKARPVARAAPAAVAAPAAAAIVSGAERERHNHVQHVMQQREKFLRGIAATKTRARWLVRTGLLSFVTGSAIFAAALRFLKPVVGLVGWAIGALGLALIIAGIVLHIKAGARRRRVNRNYPVGPWLGLGVGGNVEPGPFGKLSFLDDSQGDPAVPAVQPDQREPQRQQGVDGRRGVGVPDEGRLEPDGGDELLGHRPGVRRRREEQGRAGHRAGEVLPAERVEGAHVPRLRGGGGDQRAAVELRGADPVHGVDHDLPGQGRAVLGHHVPHDLAGDGQQHHVRVVQRVGHLGHWRAARACARPAPGTVDHVVAGLLPRAAERTADIAPADHRDPHGAGR